MFYWVCNSFGHLEELLLKQHPKIKASFTFSIQWLNIYPGVFQHNSPWWIWSSHMGWNYGASCCNWWYTWNIHSSGFKLDFWLRQVENIKRALELSTLSSILAKVLVLCILKLYCTVHISYISCVCEAGV